jgi:hypothetical protein
MADRGRPSGFRPEYAEQARKLCELGATDIELADFFEVSDRTIYRWQAKHPEFCQALKAGKVSADERVERSLYHKAVGYSYDAVKIITVAIGNNQGSEVRHEKYREHVPPDTTAMIFWLKNRRPEAWRDKHEVEHVHRVEEIPDDELARIARSGGAGTSPKTNGSALTH